MLGSPLKQLSSCLDVFMTDVWKRGRKVQRGGRDDEKNRMSLFLDPRLVEDHDASGENDSFLLSGVSYRLKPCFVTCYLASARTWD